MNIEKIAKEKPILFSTEMVQAILAGRKTQTRRVVKDPDNAVSTIINDGIPYALNKDDEYIQRPCPFGEAGDRLWVRETWADLFEISNGGLKGIAYKADGVEYYGEEHEIDTSAEYMKWRPSIFMPREYCRLFLEIAKVRIERLQDISIEDCIAEGIDAEEDLAYSCFRELWNSINEKRGYGWESNPWVWVIPFHLHENTKLLFSIDK